MRNKLYKIATATIALAITFTFSCSEEGTFKDPSDGKIYKTVKIGKQVWMAENLNYAAKGSKCYGNGGQVIVGFDDDDDKAITRTLSNDEIQANCAKYGRLYDWETAIKACPKGWHLPSDDEWGVLVDAVGGEEAGKYLKAKSGWNDNEEGKSGNGIDKYSFSALPGGGGRSGGFFSNVGYGGYWWSASEYDGSSAYGRDMNYNYENVNHGNGDKRLLFISVRCVQD